jgi:hypothetical protein
VGPDALPRPARRAGHDLAAAEVAEQARRTLAEARAARPGPPNVDLPDGGTDELAGLLNQIAFAPHTATPAQADRAAELAERYAGALRAARPWWRRLLWTVHPGPLRWRR